MTNRDNVSSIDQLEIAIADRAPMRKCLQNGRTKLCISKRAEVLHKIVSANERTFIIGNVVKERLFFFGR